MTEFEQQVNSVLDYLKVLGLRSSEAIPVLEAALGNLHIHLETYIPPSCGFWRAAKEDKPHLTLVRDEP